jgi:hypothetical protein
MANAFLDYPNVMNRPLHEWRDGIREALAPAELALCKAHLEVEAAGLATATPHPANADQPIIPHNLRNAERSLRMALAALYDAQAWMAKESACSVTNKHAHTDHVADILAHDRMYYDHAH